LAVVGSARAPGASAQLLGPDQSIREIPFTIRSDRPMIQGKVGNVDGVFMLDNGSPFPIFLNRDAVQLDEGSSQVRGKASSGQGIEVRTHAAPPVTINGMRVILPKQIESGSLGFTRSELGADFLGFIGLEMIRHNAFVLDFAHRKMTILRTDEQGKLAVAAPPNDAILTRAYFIDRGGLLPTIAGAVGSLPILIDFDIGDSGTAYLRPTTRDMLQSGGALKEERGHWSLTGLRIGNQIFGPIPIDMIEAGGPEDTRDAGSVDQLRLGATFLASHPTLWNFPAKTITFLRSGYAYPKRSR
jgi:hypothetical protein